MSVDFHENLGNVLDAEKKLTCASGKIAPFAYTQEAYDCNCAEGVTEYNYGNEQNIPFGDASTLQMSGTVLAKGLRSQASSFTRMSVNHFFGRASFNVNKLSDYMKTFLEQFLSFLESNCNEWSPTTNYVQNDVVYMMTTINNAPAKRTFIADTASLNLPPVDNAGQLINTDKWTEVSGNVDSFRALSAEINSLTVNGISCFKGNMTADNDMTVHGNLYVDGTSYVVNEAQLQVSGDYQTLRNGAESGIGSGGYSGIVIENYNGEDKHSFIGVDSDGEVRVGKNAFTHSTVYTDISSFDGSWYDGLTRTLASAYPSHVFTAVTAVKLQDVAYNAIAGNQTVAGYYVLQNGTWYGDVTVSGGQFVIGNAVTDSSDIATLNALTRNELVYYITITDNELQGIGTNQPVLTRSETTDFANGDILMWCASEKKAVKITRPASTNSYLKATLTNGAVSYTWEAGLSVDNATCFNGCTYADAKADIRCGTACNVMLSPPNSTSSYKYYLLNTGNISAPNIIGQVGNNTAIISKTNSSLKVKTTSTYGAIGVANVNDTTCIWVRFNGYFGLNMRGSCPISIVCEQATAPTGVTFTEPEYLTSVADTTCNANIPVALCTSCNTVGASTSCALTFNPATGALIADKSIGVGSLGSCGAQNIICRLIGFPTYNQWVLLHDITDWYNGSTDVSPQYMIGRFYLSRQSGGIASVILDTTMAHSYGRDGDNLECNSARQRFLYNILSGLDDWQTIKPVIICENATGKVYTALRKTFGLNLNLSFSGANYGTIINCVVPGGGAGVSIPSGWTHLYEAPLGGRVSCAEDAIEAKGFRCYLFEMSNCCWIKAGTVSNVSIGGSLELTITKNYSFLMPEVKKINISFGGGNSNLSPKVIEDACSPGTTPILSCLRFGKASGSQCPVDIYIKTNINCLERYITSYCFTGRGSFAPSFTCVSNTCASACACKCDIPLHANGHYINGCQFDTTLTNTACVNASCCVNTPLVSASDPGNTASKVCNLTFQAFCTDASCVKTTQQITFNGETGQLCWNINDNSFDKCIKTECYGIMPNNIRMNNGGLMSYISVMAFCPACAVCAFKGALSCFTNFGVIGTMILDGDLCPISFITCSSNVFSFYKPTSTSPFKTLCATATSTLSANCISTLHLMSLR